MRRIPEPEELMDDADQALAYAQEDFSEANRLCVDLLEAQSKGPLDGYLLDLGCGPADIPLALARRHPGLHIDAVDGSRAMLDLAQRKLETAEPDIQRRIDLLREYLPSPGLPEGAYALIVSNSLLHHLADPMVLWQTVNRCAQAGTRLAIMDLARPASELAVDAVVESYAIDAPDVLRRDFRNSLFAAYTVEEVEQQLQRAGLESLVVRTVSDRHLAVTGRL
jgi:SAM-dependent methyltransferase